MAQSPHPTERRLELAMPDLTRRIENLHEDLRSSFTAELRPIANKVSRLESLFLDLTTGVAPLRLNVSFPGPNSVRDVVQAQVAPVITSQEPIIGFIALSTETIGVGESAV